MVGNLHTLRMLAAGSCLFALTTACTDTDNADYNNLKLIAEEVNKTTPRVIDEYTRLDSATVSSPDTLHYYYTLIEEDIDSLTIDVKEIKGLLKESAQANLDTLKGKKIFKGAILMQYIYNDKNSRHLFDYTISSKNKTVAKQRKEQ